MLLLQALFVCEGYTDDTLYGAGEEDGVCGGGDMIIDNDLLDQVSERAKAAPRLRVN